MSDLIEYTGLYLGVCYYNKKLQFNKTVYIAFPYGTKHRPYVCHGGHNVCFLLTRHLTNGKRPHNSVALITLALAELLLIDTLRNGPTFGPTFVADIKFKSVAQARPLEAGVEW